MNWQLFSFVFTIASGVTIGILMTIALVMGYDQIPNIIAVCVVGFFLSIPIAWLVEKKLATIGVASSKTSV